MRELTYALALREAMREEMTKNEAIKIFNESIKPKLIESYVNEEINEADLREYSYDNGLNADDVIKNEKERLSESIKTKAEVNLKSTKLISEKLMASILIS